MKYLKRWLYRILDKLFLDGCSRYNSLAVRKSSRSKLQARQMFLNHHLPVAKGQVFFWPWKAFAFVKQYDFPVVIKPNVGGYSRGSYFPIENRWQLLRAIFLAKIWWPFTVIEQYLDGKNYRVVVTEKGIDVVMRRYPPFVEGDGVRTLSELIDEENEVRRKMKLAPVIHYIEKKGVVKKHLKKQGLDFSFVPDPGRRVYLFHRVALAPGGVLETISVEGVTKKNKELFKKVLELFKANILGIDVIMEKGISTDFDQQQCILLEVNSRPYLKMHEYPRWGEVPDMKALYKRLDQIEVKDKDLF